MCVSDPINFRYLDAHTVANQVVGNTRTVQRRRAQASTISVTCHFDLNVPVCPAGSYEIRPGSGMKNAGGTLASTQSCVPCPEFTYSTGIGNVQCTGCSLSSDGIFNTECSQCPTNTYASKAGALVLMTLHILISANRRGIPLAFRGMYSMPQVDVQHWQGKCRV